MVRHYNILLVEDNIADAQLLEYELDDVPQYQFTLVRAGSLEEGLIRARAGAFDIILLDLDLPDSRGIESVRRVCEALPHIPIVVLTGLNDEDIGLQALHRGAQDYLIKGESEGWEIWRSVRYAIERKRSPEASRGVREIPPNPADERQNNRSPASDV